MAIPRYPARHTSSMTSEDYDPFVTGPHQVGSRTWQARDDDRSRLFYGIRRGMVAEIVGIASAGSQAQALNERLCGAAGAVRSRAGRD